MNVDYREYLKKNCSKPILIYGAGIVAYYFAYELIKNQQIQNNITSFVVSDPRCDVSNYWGIPVLGISEYKGQENNYCLIIATKENVHNEIETYLRKQGWQDYYCLSSEEYMRIRDNCSEVAEEYIIGQFERIRTTFGRMENNLYHVSKLLYDSAEKYNYQPWGDRENYLEDFREFRSKDTYVQEIQELISGLQEESVQTVFQILDRLNRLCDNQTILYSSEEKDKLKQLEDIFELEKYKISDSWYTYKNYNLPINHFDACVFWYEHGIGLLENLDKIKDKCLIDAGGFIADSALVFSKYWNGKIYSFEADSDNYNYQNVTIQINKLKNVIPVNMALTDKTGVIDLHKATEISCNTLETESRFSPLKGEPVEIAGTSIDDFVAEHGLSVGLIKSDVEGAECSLLKGAEKTIKTQRPALIISIYHSINDFFHIKKQIENMQAGYQFKIFRPVLKGSFLLETCLICEVV